MTLRALLAHKFRAKINYNRFSACLGLLLFALTAFPISASEVDPALKERLQLAITDTHSFADKFDATVWLTDMALRLEQHIPDPNERVEILQYIHQESQRVDLPPELILAVIDIESAFDRFAISPAGARGLMQVMPFWLNELDRPDDNLFDIQTNLRIGCTILRYYMDMENNEFSPALARYNGSTGQTWYPERVMGRLSTHWFRQ
ncbi:MAG: lytic transglycosylase domain-containing protein [Gammaproteobacteria bacterium]|nr:lytic transglycosylase domain-containing protein [Gammaproteobacteria bacterium]MCP4091082.1 lytic transglycosylase domain-containing protein [Gammaproteobacteria bacterium]MCP4277392.1 lytic transglycosylase domain-containing protein [Gammaproteobacteria bacterium]MCP4831547.1 lytic transglycosylase domain-containing protein [Gammaproteobacteria bacterium]MCP4927770.1 lytic transglycosylase domain-containing protein [Gammaproteobacteria bacterium]